MNLHVEDSIAICIVIAGIPNSIAISILLTRVGDSETVVLEKKTHFDIPELLKKINKSKLLIYF